MSIADSLLSEFTQEMNNTRKLLELIPDEKAGWKPHPKSRTLGQLAIHLAFLPVWVQSIMQKTVFDLDPSKDGGFKRPEVVSRDETVRFFDENVSNGKVALTGVSDRDLFNNWTLKSGERIIFSLPRATVLRLLVLSHSIHHRGQLTVYLRLQDIPLPNIYGSTADTES